MLAASLSISRLSLGVLINMWRDSRRLTDVTDRQTDAIRHKQTNRQVDREKDRQTDSQTDTQTDRQTHRHTYRQADRQTDG